MLYFNEMLLKALHHAEEGLVRGHAQHPPSRLAASHPLPSPTLRLPALTIHLSELGLYLQAVFG
jgi:hypothetical protein